MCKIYKKIVFSVFIFFNVVFVNASHLEDAFMQMGFEKQTISGEKISVEKQINDVFSIFHMAGYLTKDTLWQSIAHIRTIADADKKNIHQRFLSVLDKTKGLQTQTKDFQVDSFRQQIGNTLDPLTWMDFCLYLAQYGCDRSPGQERHEMVEKEWMKGSENDYMVPAKELGLIAEKEPQHNHYDFVWIAGAGRPRFLQRFQMFKKYQSQVSFVSPVYALAGFRELYADIDGIGEGQSRIEEGKKYLTGLADQFKIPYNKEQPFIKYSDGETAKKQDRMPSRFYLNTISDQRLTEAHLARDLVQEIPNAIVIDARVEEGYHRATTQSTSQAAIAHFINRIKGGEFGSKKTFNLLLVSNNPFIKRQELVVKRVIREGMQKHHELASYIIKVEGIGSASQSDIQVIHAELGLLFSEMWKLARGTQDNQELLNSLLFTTRSKELVGLPVV